MESVSQQGEDLVPIRLEIDHDTSSCATHSHGTLKTRTLTSRRFAQSICEDIGLPTSVFIPQIKEQITAQIVDHQTTNAFKAKPTFDFTGETRGKGSLEDKDLRWWTKWRRQVESLPFGNEQSASTDAAASAHVCANGADKDVVKHAGDSSEEDETRSEPLEIVDTTPAEELRMMIKLDITVGSMNLVDQFEWDANESDPACGCREVCRNVRCRLGPCRRVQDAIAHSIREQVSVHVKSLAMTGHTFDGRPIADEELRAAFLGPVSKANLSRSELESYNFTPRLLQLTESEIERLIANANAKPDESVVRPVVVVESICPTAIRKRRSAHQQCTASKQRRPTPHLLCRPSMVSATDMEACRPVVQPRALPQCFHRAISSYGSWHTDARSRRSWYSRPQEAQGQPSRYSL